ncbi:MAG: DUF3783 domain-containing protein [Clostridiales bacterium]|nr:DUF3783 domain-containing protein [Clostridiales bacterium]
MNQAMVLCYNMEGERADQVRALAEALNIQAFLVPREAYLQKIGALCGLFEPTKEAYHGEGFEGEMMLMAFFEKGMLGQFLDGFREQGLPPVPLKAMLTEKNSQWNSMALQAELLDEYEHFKKMHKTTKKARQ